MSFSYGFIFFRGVPCENWILAKSKRKTLQPYKLTEQIEQLIFLTPRIFMVLAQYVPEAEVEGEREWEDHLYRVQQQDVS